MVSPISPAVATALGGLRDASKRMDKAAADLTSAAAEGDTVTLSEAAVAMKLAQRQFEASAKVLEARDEMLKVLTRPKRV